MFSGYGQITEHIAPDTPATDAGVPDPESLSMGTLAREIELQRRPSWLLCKFMNALEQKRQAKGLGWSRPWNKVDLTIFRTHTHDLGSDAVHFAGVEAVLGQCLAGAPSPYAEFVAELRRDPALMAFTFYHNRATPDAQFEGLTLSFGRRVKGDASKRDRLDLILEDRRVDGRVDGRVDLLRIFVCPWSEFQHGRRHHLVQCADFPCELHAAVQDLYSTSVRCYQTWKDQPSRQWQHWSQRYIDYFGARRFIPAGTSFT